MQSEIPIHVIPVEDAAAVADSVDLRQLLEQKGLTSTQIERVLNPRQGRLRRPAKVAVKRIDDLLRGVYSAIPDERKIDELDKWIARQGLVAVRYREQIRGQIASSGLAQALPGGIDLLPDFYASVPAWLRGWYLLNRPRNFYQLGRHVARHLHWYLNPTERVRVPPEFTLTALSSLYFLFVIFGQPLLHELPRWLMWFFPGAMLFVGSRAVYSRSSLALRQKFNIERIEFYEYLTGEYAEAIDPGRLV